MGNKIRICQIIDDKKFMIYLHLDELDKVNIPNNTKQYIQSPIMPFTGKIDRNGMEVYLSDIVRNSVSTGVVMCCKKSCEYFLLSDGISMCIEECEVIGNIYEISRPAIRQLTPLLEITDEDALIVAFNMNWCINDINQLKERIGNLFCDDKQPHSTIHVTILIAISDWLRKKGYQVGSGIQTIKLPK